MRSASIILVVIATACSPGALPTTTQTQSVTTTTTSVTASTPVTTSPVVLVTNPATERAINDEDLALMPLVDLPGSWIGYAPVTTELEDNDRIVLLNTHDPDDEAQDVSRYNRLSGYRTVHRPTRFPEARAVAIDSWVHLFFGDRGASEYLADFARDVAKDLDTGHQANQRVVEALTFAVDPIGDETLGLILTVAPATDPTARLTETIIGFRVGRLLGMVSVLEHRNIDSRIGAQRLAEALHERMLAVLDGSITAEPEPVVAAIGPYGFSYEQTIVESYVQVIYPIIELEGDLDGDGIVDEGGDGVATTTTTAPTDSTAPPDDGSGETTTSTSTTTTTRLIQVTNRGSVTATGAVVGADIDCELTFSLVQGVQRRRYIKTDEGIWSKPATSQRFAEADPDSVAVASDLIYCPGWPTTLELSGLGDHVKPGTGERVDLDGIPAEKFELGYEELFAVGLAPEESRGIRFNRFDLWLAADQAEPWVLGIDISYSGTTESLELAIGPGFYPGADVSIDIEFFVTSLDDPELVVERPTDIGT